MPIPTDRGMVALTRKAGKTRSIAVCLKIVNGQPRHIFATHGEPGKVYIHPGVELIPTDYGAHSKDPVEVYVDPAGGVHVAAPSGVR